MLLGNHTEWFLRLPSVFFGVASVYLLYIFVRKLFDEKKKFRVLEREAATLHLQRLQSGRVESIQTSALHLDILRDLKRINSHLTTVGQQLLEEANELNPSRLKEIKPTWPPYRGASKKKYS